MTPMQKHYASGHKPNGKGACLECGAKLKPVPMWWACVYCGEPVNDGCPDPRVFECCGEIGHVEEVPIDG